MWRLNNILLKNNWVKEEITDETKRYRETSENNNTTQKNFWDVANAVIRGKFISLHSYLQKQKKSQVSSLTLHKELEKEVQKQPKVSRKKEKNKN